MKIAHVCSFYTPAIGGVKQVVEELAKRQIKEGHEVHVYTSDWDKEERVKKKNDIIGGVHVHRCFHIAKIANFATLWPSVFPKLLKENFDVIHSHVYGHLHYVLAALAAKLSGAKSFHTTHCPWTDAHRSSFGRLGLFLSYQTFSRIAAKMTDKFIAITPWEVDFMRKYGIDKKQIEVIPNGMDNLFFNVIKNNDFKKEHNVKGKMVLFFGRLNVTKGPDKFVQIAKEILKKRRDLTFVMRGPDEGMKQRVIELIGDEKQIILLPESRDRNEIIKMYQAADVFVLPSFREGLPLTLFEAMAAGLPIVASPVNGIPYEMKDPENGFLVEYGNNKKFEEKIIEFLDNPGLRKEVAKKNLEKSRNYTWDIINERTLGLYGK